MAEARVELPGSYRPAASGAQQVGTADPGAEVEVTVTLRGPDLPSADDITGPPLTPDAYAAAYGADAGDAAKVKEELEKFGLQVYDVSLAGRSMHARGTVAQLDAAFGVSLGEYESASQGRFRGREGNITIPASLDGIVTGVFGLDDRRVARRNTTPTLTPLPPALTPADLEARYDFPPGDGAGQTIAIAEFYGAYFPSDLQAFCQKYGRPVPSVTPVSVGFPLLTLDQITHLPPDERKEMIGASGEVMMDVQIIATLCPAAQITIYFAPYSQKGWIDLVNKAAAANPLPVALSISWGLAEDAPDFSGAAIQEVNLRLQAASMLGMTICASSGDDGVGDQVLDHKAHVNFPATSPFVLSVGGTMLTGTPAEEVTWWNAPGDRSVRGGGSTGGGVSAVFDRPAWQTVTVPSLNQGSIDGRVVPDVSALAGSPFYDLIFLGHDAPNGGTSASTPLWAALLARMQPGLAPANRRRFFPPLLYGNGPDGQPVGQAGCTDITVGDNRSTGMPNGYRAGPGYDAVTGWGTPIGTTLQQLLS
jgi:kumamolisin